MVERKQYMEKLRKLQNQQIIKVVTGVRRCGKSTLLKQFQQFLLKSGVRREQIIDINFEAVENEHLLDYHALHDYVTQRLISGKIVYLELIRRGYNVSIGKVGELEVDFVAERNGETEYYQVSATVMSEDTFDREIAPLKRIRDNYPKYIITMDVKHHIFTKMT